MGYCVIKISDIKPKGNFFYHFLVANKWGGGVLVTKSDKEERSKGS